MEIFREGYDADKCYKLNQMKDGKYNHYYDSTRQHLNAFVKDGKLVPITTGFSRQISDKYTARLDELNFKESKKKQNTVVDFIFSGGVEKMRELAFGDQTVNYAKTGVDNSNIKRMPEIEKWAKDIEKFLNKHFGKENVIGVVLHLDETTPHIHALVIPVANRKKAGRASYIYHLKDDPSVTITSKEYKALTSSMRKKYEKGEIVERKSSECVSFSGVFGDNKEQRHDYAEKLHTDLYEEVGKKYGLERGVNSDDLSPEEKEEVYHKTSGQLQREKEDKLREIQALDDDIEQRKVEDEELKNKTGLLEKGKAMLLGTGNLAEQKRDKKRADEAELKQKQAEDRAELAEQKQKQAESDRDDAEKEKQRLEQKLKTANKARITAEKEASETKETTTSELVKNYKDGFKNESGGVEPKSCDLVYLGKLAGKAYKSNKELLNTKHNQSKEIERLKEANKPVEKANTFFDYMKQLAPNLVEALMTVMQLIIEAFQNPNSDWMSAIDSHKNDVMTAVDGFSGLWQMNNSRETIDELVKEGSIRTGCYDADMTRFDISQQLQKTYDRPRKNSEKSSFERFFDNDTKSKNNAKCEQVGVRDNENLEVPLSRGLRL